MRAAQLQGERCTQVEVDHIFCTVAQARSARLGFSAMLHALSIIAHQLYPDEPTPAAAYHELLGEHLLAWMMQLEHALAAKLVSTPPASHLFGRHAAALQRVFEIYLATAVQPVVPAVAAHPAALLQWPQFALFAADFELAPAFASWAQLARWFCHVGTCVADEAWHAPESHGATLAQFTLLLGWAALEQPDRPAASDEPPGSPAYAKAKSLFAHMFRSKGAVHCGLGVLGAGMGAGS